MRDLTKGPVAGHVLGASVCVHLTLNLVLLPREFRRKLPVG